MSIYRNFVFRKILNEVRPVELWGEAFPALLFFIVWVGFTKRDTPCLWRPYFGLYHIILFKSEKVRLCEPRGLSNAAFKNALWLVKIAPSIIRIFFFSGKLAVKNQRALTKYIYIHHHLVLYEGQQWPRWCISPAAFTDVTGRATPPFASELEQPTFPACRVTVTVQEADRRASGSTAARRIMVEPMTFAR